MATHAASINTNPYGEALPDDLAAQVAAVDPQRILPERVDLLYREAPGGIVINLLVAAVVTLVLGANASLDSSLQWWAALAVVSLGRGLLNRAYGKRKVRDDPKWLRWFAIGAISVGATWGFAGSVFFPAGSVEEQVFLAFILAGIFTGAIAVFAPVWQVYALYGIAMITPITYVFAAFGSALFFHIALLMPIFLIVNVSAARRLSGVFAEGLRLRHAFKGLAGEYRGLNMHLESRLDELAQAHAQVEASGRKLALYTERAPIAVFETDETATIMGVNPAAERMFGFSGPELEGRSMLRTLVAADEPAFGADVWEAFVQTREPLSELQARCTRRDGITIACEFSLTPLVSTGGELVSVIAQCQDVTRQIEAERLKREFTSTLSHELRTPLTSIIGTLQLVNSGVMGDVEADVLDLTSVAERNGLRLLDMINDILDIEKIESGRFEMEFEVIELGALVRESVVLNRAFAERVKVSLEVRGEPAVVAVRADRKRLLQVLTNLISNAAKFSPEGEAVEVAVLHAGDTVRVQVDDRGPGIPADFRGRIFSRFAQADSALTRKKGGTGLGLAISKRMVEMMAGSVGFEDRAGGGTTFFIVLPVAPGGTPDPA
ncbi:MAG: ATP-binding protein [Proteobacteria bacterium]|nr:ATP-binding protein [Pseudomonadota bacterium]